MEGGKGARIQFIADALHQVVVEPQVARRSRKKFGFSEKSTYLAIVKAPETIVSKARTNETDDTYNIKRIAYREKFYSL